MSDDSKTNKAELTIALTPVQLIVFVAGLFALIALRRRCRAR